MMGGWRPPWNGCGHAGARFEEPVNHWRGHAIEETSAGWVYPDGSRVADDPARACGACGASNTPEGHDGCIGHVPDALNACCGHGSPREAYVQLAHVTLRGHEALTWIHSLADVPRAETKRKLLFSDSE